MTAYHRMPVVWLALVLVLSEPIGALKDPIIPEALFYPFGVDVGDLMQPPGDDLTTSWPINTNFTFFNESHRLLFVNSNGVISFVSSMTTYTPEPFPRPSRMITPYWSDIDTDENNGRIYYRQSKDAILLDRATKDVRSAFWSKGLYFFKAKWIFIATWHNVTYFGGNRTTPVNSFQVVLITDEKHSVTMFNYGRLSWTTGTVSGGNPITGLGGTAAQVGYNSGDKVNFYALPGSRRPSILQVAQTTNVKLKGRWMFRVDNATVEAGRSCAAETGVAPSFDCPTLEGPVVIDRRWVEFYCVIPTKETSDQAAFNVTFLFNGEPSPKVPSIFLRPPNLKATLHEKHLTHKLLGQWISCRVSSFWLQDVDNVQSQALESTNSYWAGIEVSPQSLWVHEGDPKPAVLTLKSTIPITCKRRESVLEDSCDLTLKLTTSPDILVRNQGGRECMMTLREKDWKPEERKAYKLEESIEFFAKMDSFRTYPRWNSLTIDIDPLSDKVTADGQSYKNMWSRHKLPDIVMYHHDVPQGVCMSTGDPHVTTFDRLFYTIYATGQFTYVQTTYGTPIEVQLRHRPCGQTVSCVCGVAAREKDIILVADMCTDSRLHFITYNDKLRKEAGIKRDDNGRVFEINLPSKVKVVGYVNYWGISVQIYVTSSEYRRIEGLCGSFDNNKRNDLKVKGTNFTTSVSDVVESWRVPLGKSLFDGVVTTLPIGSEVSPNDDSSFCTCMEGVSSCQEWMADDNFMNGPNVGANNNVIPKTVANFWDNKIGRRRRSFSEDSMSDDVDWEYDGRAFNYSSPEPRNRHNNTSGVTEEDARRHCWRVLWDESPGRATCENLVSMSDVNGTIDKCILDIRLTGNLSWADDKIPEIQNLCIFKAITAFVTESNSTIDEITSIVQNITSDVCLPQDCSKHGICRNNTCICDKGYVGSDCALSEDAVPNILRTLGPSSCDLDRYPCQKVEMVTKDVKSLPNLVCKVEVTKYDNSKQSFQTSASVETMDTSSCTLPTDVLHGKLSLLRTTSTTSPPEEEPVDFYSLPLGSSVLHYSISISNNGIRFSNPHPLTVFNSMCYSCDGLNCTKRIDSCLINGYCFANGQRNPFNPDCDRCNPSVSTSFWTKVPGILCNPCLSSPCSDGYSCQSSLNGKYQCIDKPDVTVTVVAIATVIAVILTVVVIYFILRRK